MTGTETAATVRRVDDEQLYEIVVDGERAGLTAYRDHGDQRVFYHTETAEAYAGQGLAGRLVREALTDVRAAGKRFVPVCPYVKKFLAKHEEFADIADPVTPEILHWIREQLG
ncbi:GNAT family N-acetyltransferase [Streptomyces sp. Da 82-17]|uniref:GNAT family N-acetyltransferase n=1 Tax=Streptomyces sp. Da 82-17 TaxID=3377116 RepID=UPI0038D4DD09